MRLVQLGVTCTLVVKEIRVALEGPGTTASIVEASGTAKGYHFLSFL